MNDKTKDNSSSKSLVVRFAGKYGIDERKVLDTLKQTAFRQNGENEITDAQMMALLIVAEQYDLNPFTKEIFAFPDKKNGIVPVVSVDGWSRIINEHPMFDGMDFVYSDEVVRPGDERFPGLAHPAFEWIECVIYRKDRSHPIKAREYLDEVYRAPFSGEKNGRSYVVNGPWQTHTRRFHRHKALIQDARIAFGFAGIYDQDEAERIIAGEVVSREINGKSAGASKADSLQAALEQVPATTLETEIPAAAEPAQAVA